MKKGSTYNEIGLKKVIMLPCAPYISNMCQPAQPEQAPDTSSSLIKQETEVKISDVKSIKVDLVYPVCDLVKSENKLRGSIESLPREFSTFKPESPDVVRSAKILEKAKKTLAQSEENKQGSDSEVEDKVTKLSLLDERKEQEKLGAISKR